MMSIVMMMMMMIIVITVIITVVVHAVYNILSQDMKILLSHCIVSSCTDIIIIIIIYELKICPIQLKVRTVAMLVIRHL